ncbi:DUF1206 domain-containing protein [Lysobacter korlensis]|uniref:DUF1206 domain-containing protein n=1 Tax=Lysobacter korlensis TaxID=553636 RepID=A0ABV6RVU3_9GAMM
MVSSSARSPLRKAANSRPVELGARIGYAVNGLLHGVIGGLAIAVALGTGDNPDQSGALSALASTPGGGALLWVMVVGFAALGLWQLLETLLVRDADTKRRWIGRVKEGGKAVVYLSLAVSALRFAVPGGSSGGDSTRDFTARLLGQPFGVLLLLLLAALVIGVGGFFIVKGVRKKFLEDIRTPTGSAGDATVVVGVAGYVAKGIALVVVGVLFGVAAVTTDPEQATGLDAALLALAELPYGVAVLIAVGVGFIAYGVYCVVRARRARL